MLYMKVVGKSREEVCVDFRTCFVSFYWTAEASPPDCVIVRNVVKIVLKSVQILRFILAIQFALPPNDSNSFRETFARAHIWCNGFIVMLARKTDNSIVKSSLSPGTRKETFIQGRDRRENSGRAQSDGKSQKKSIVPHVTSPRYYRVISVERAQFLYF